MANAVGFEGANNLLQAPPGVSQDDCLDLPVFVDKKHAVSCWRLTEEELAEVAKTGVIWVGIRGQYVPPIYVAGVTPIHLDDGTTSKAEPYIAPAPRRKSPPPRRQEKDMA